MYNAVFAKKEDEELLQLFVLFLLDLSGRGRRPRRPENAKHKFGGDGASTSQTPQSGTSSKACLGLHLNEVKISPLNNDFIMSRLDPEQPPSGREGDRLRWKESARALLSQCDGYISVLRAGSLSRYATAPSRREPSWDVGGAVPYRGCALPFSGRRGAVPNPAWRDIIQGLPWTSS